MDTATFNLIVLSVYLDKIANELQGRIDKLQSTIDTLKQGRCHGCIILKM